MAERFYTPDPLAPGEYTLTGAEAHHLAAVRRFGPGDRVVLFNGDGNDYPAQIVAAAKKSVTLRVTSAEAADRELGFPLVVASALPKGDRADFLIEKLTELGVTRFVPLVTARSVVQPRDAKVGKLERVVIEASKQCGRNRLMAIDPSRRWDEHVTGATARPPLRLVLHPLQAARLSDLSTGDVRAGGVTIAVGPEGGFTDDEVAAAEAAGWRRVGL